MIEWRCPVCWRRRHAVYLPLAQLWDHLRVEHGWDHDAWNAQHSRPPANQRRELAGAAHDVGLSADAGVSHEMRRLASAVVVVLSEVERLEELQHGSDDD